MSKDNYEISIRIIGKSQTIVASALKELPKVFDSVIITGIKVNEREVGFRGYAFCKLRRTTDE
jgi:hypothetical protein